MRERELGQRKGQNPNVTDQKKSISRGQSAGRKDMMADINEGTA